MPITDSKKTAKAPRLRLGWGEALEEVSDAAAVVPSNDVTGVPSDVVTMVEVAVVVHEQADQLVQGGAVCQSPEVQPAHVAFGQAPGPWCCPHHEVQGPVVQGPAVQSPVEFSPQAEPNGPYQSRRILGPDW
ncbi:hypothetical protein N7462_008915 [Penicillium macrosclerotiorum]|uniref:uncharacterized protein n=1 Tax=Penicillium macrosclerotiorum TaxID=303699 RepID=UPI002548FF90|nr:uncharacterized protein N7462_008915 [Penicillium macrosclerotiorum]KAJ5676018.1 hypothetical protein N7462_008915 [Penicillium macrosclerotiorum]